MLRLDWSASVRECESSGFRLPHVFADNFGRPTARIPREHSPIGKCDQSVELTDFEIFD